MEAEIQIVAAFNSGRLKERCIEKEKAKASFLLLIKA